MLEGCSCVKRRRVKLVPRQAVLVSRRGSSMMLPASTEVNYMEIKGNKVLDFYISNNSVDEMLHPMWVRNAEMHIYFARLDIGAIVIRRAGLEVSPDLVQSILCELDQNIRLVD